MKKLILLLTAFISLTATHGQTNVYQPFPEDSASWVFDGWNSLSGGYNHSTIYKMKGDTIINSTSYNKIYIQTLTFYYINYPPNPIVGYNNFSIEHYWGGIRQDSINKKVYLILPTMNSDTLLFDFNLIIGDTLPPSYLNNQGGSNIVTGIDSIQIGNKYHKKFNFNVSNPYIWVDSFIEGIGSWAGLDNIYQAFEGGSDLACFNENSVGGEYSGECVIEPFTVSIHNISLVLNFKISPNPFTNETLLQTDKTLRNASLTISNSIGQQVKQIKNISGQSIILNRGNLPSGLYFVQLTQDGKILMMDKIIITDK